MSDKQNTSFGKIIADKLTSPGWMIILFLIGAGIFNLSSLQKTAPWAGMDLLIVFIFVYLIESKVKRESMTDEEIIAKDINIKEIR